MLKLTLQILKAYPEATFLGKKTNKQKIKIISSTFKSFNTE